MQRIAPLLLLLLPCSVACNGYGSPQSLATAENLLAGAEFVGRWECPATTPDCDGESREVAWLDVARRNGGLEIAWKRATHRDSFVGYDALDRRLHVDLPRDTITAVFRGNLLRLGGDTILEVTAALPRQSPQTVPVIPLYTWTRVHLRGDTLALEVLDGERLAQRLEQQPGKVRPVSILRSDGPSTSPDVIVVALGGRGEVERFVIEAFATPSLLQRTRAVLVRGNGPDASEAVTALR